MNIFKQIQINMLSIISLVVALSALSYNTYRNELTEQNRNIRNAGFELLTELNKLQLLIDHAQYDNNRVQGNPISGWGHVLYIHDLSNLVSTDVLSKSVQLKKIWRNTWEGLGKDESSNVKITQAIDNLRTLTLRTIKMLE